MIGDTGCRLVCNLEKEYVYVGFLGSSELMNTKKFYFITKVGDEWFKSKELYEIDLDRKYIK